MTDLQRRGLLASIVGRLPATTHGELLVLDLVLERLESARSTPSRAPVGFPEALVDSLIRGVQGALAERERQRAELQEHARDEMLSSVDRSAAVESLQHVAEPIPVMEAIRQGIETVRKLDGDEHIVELAKEIAKVGTRTVPWDVSDVGGEGG
jgi:hypothetical protein